MIRALLMLLEGLAFAFAFGLLLFGAVLWACRFEKVDLDGTLDKDVHWRQ